MEMEMEINAMRSQQTRITKGPRFVRRWLELHECKFATI